MSVAVVLVLTDAALADGGHSMHVVSQLSRQATTTVTYEGNRVGVTFVPVDLSSWHNGELAASQPKHVVKLPEDMTMVGFRYVPPTRDIMASFSMGMAPNSP